MYEFAYYGFVQPQCCMTVALWGHTVPSYKKGQYSSAQNAYGAILQSHRDSMLYHTDAQSLNTSIIFKKCQNNSELLCYF